MPVDTTALVIAREEAQVIVARVISNNLAETGQNLGSVSVNYLVKKAAELGLSEEDVSDLVVMRNQYECSLPKVFELLGQGFSINEVCGCYRIRKSLQDEGTVKGIASIKKIAELTRTFAEADPENDDFGEIIVEVYRVISSIRSYHVKYVDRSIEILCEFAERFNCATIESALFIIGSNDAKRDRLLPDDYGDDIRTKQHRCIDYCCRTW